MKKAKRTWTAAETVEGGLLNRKRTKSRTNGAFTFKSAVIYDYGPLRILPYDSGVYCTHKAILRAYFFRKLYLVG